jgi:hypothetical protein
MLSQLRELVQGVPDPVARAAELQFFKNQSENLAEVIQENREHLLRTQAAVVEVHEHGHRGREQLAIDTSHAIAAVERTTEAVARDTQSEFAILAERTIQSQSGVESLVAALRRHEEELRASPPRPMELMDVPQVSAVEAKVMSVTQTVAQMMESQQTFESHLEALVSSPQNEARDSKEQAMVAVSHVRQLHQRFNSYAQEMGSVLEKMKDENHANMQDMSSKLEAERRTLERIRSEYQEGVSEVLRLRGELANTKEQIDREREELLKLSESSTTRTTVGVPPPLPGLTGLPPSGSSAVILPIASRPTSYTPLGDSASGSALVPVPPMPVPSGPPPALTTSDAVAGAVGVLGADPPERQQVEVRRKPDHEANAQQDERTQPLENERRHGRDHGGQASYEHPEGDKEEPRRNLAVFGAVRREVPTTASSPVRGRGRTLRRMAPPDDFGDQAPAEVADGSAFAENAA